LCVSAAFAARSSSSFSANRQWFGKNLSGYLKYYRNGFGRADRGYTLADLSADLSTRLARGQVFNYGRDYLATGLRIQWTPLLELNPLLILNLRQQLAIIAAGKLQYGARRVPGVWRQHWFWSAPQRIPRY
jgi:hypothetical protein